MGRSDLMHQLVHPESPQKRSRVRAASQRQPQRPAHVGRRDDLRPGQIFPCRIDAGIQHLFPPERPRQRLDHGVVDPRPRRPRGPVRRSTCLGMCYPPALRLCLHQDYSESSPADATCLRGQILVGQFTSGVVARIVRQRAGSLETSNVTQRGKRCQQVSRRGCAKAAWRP